MATTTIRLDDDLKARVSAAAERANTTPHAFILEAIERTVDQAEQDDEFQRLADRRWLELMASGRTLSFDAFKSYAAARAGGGKPARPRARKLTTGR